eukprot:COSAG02_NODE_269_length_26468_cov_4.489021_20_plen_64_part_00
MSSNATVQEKIGLVQDIAVELLRLIFMGVEMMDEQKTLGTYGVGQFSEIYAVRRLAATRPPRR